MTIFAAILGVVGAVLVIGLAAVGGLALIGVIRGDDHSRDLRERARRAEREIMEIGRQAKVAILGEALRRAYGSAGRHAARHTDGEQDRRP
jgi:hypothetical protein